MRDPQVHRAGVFAAWMLALGGFGCLHHQARGIPLYSPAQPARNPVQVARLYGPIATVDGRDVRDAGRSFELEPGCHVVVTAKQMLDLSDAVSVSNQFSPIMFAFRMQPAHAYVIESLDRNGGSAGAAFVQARDQAPDGTKTPVPPTSSAQIIEACRAWRPE